MRLAITSRRAGIRDTWQRGMREKRQLVRACVLSLALFSAVLLSAATRAQEPAEKTTLLKTGLLGLGVEPGLALKEYLLKRTEVQEELKLTTEQKRQIEAVQKEVDRTDMLRAHERQRLKRELTARGDAEALTRLGQQERAELYALTTPSEVPVVKVLQPEQLLRLEQIQLQSDGPMAFMRPETQKRLNLSPGQVELITTIIAQGREATNQAATVAADFLPGQRRLSAEDRKRLLEGKEFASAVKDKRDSLLKIRRSTMHAIAKQLTRAQRANYLKLLGEPFDFSRAWPGQPTDPAPAGDPRASKSS